MTPQREDRIIEQYLWDTAEQDPSVLNLFALADFHEEQGDTDLAFALRWCARKGKWPKYLTQSRQWTWLVSSDMAVVKDASYVLPRPLYDVMQNACTADTAREAVGYLSGGLEVLRQIRDG